MPFTLAHPAAVLPLLRRPFVAAALVAGAVAPDLPYYLSSLGLARASAQDWYGVLLPNATQTHSLAGLVLNLPFALALVALYGMVRAPITALLPAGVRLPGREPTAGWRAKARHALWLILSAVIGIASHLVWDAVTVSRLLQNASTVVGAVAIGWYLWRHRRRMRSRDEGDARLSPALRWSVAALLVLTPLTAVAVGVPGDYHGFRSVEVVDFDRPVTVDLGDGRSETTYPATTVEAPFGTLVEGMVTGAAKRAGTAFAAVLLLYSAAWQIAAVSRRSTPRPDSAAVSRRPAQDGEATTPVER
ncbi:MULTISPECIES: DUF4184 family protein [Actinoalloteichus]|uniref:DUF4184 family protein n=1 Tax=Actinoalloteichus fjordicus TaxID=1612552 RepID=A0AAC9LFE6_9PSEU|nr:MULTISPECIES: DUF4184 family protein [Actinoalloteichus]APU15870.1 putative DUF4184 family protein [Actinoalloteichus fjordicus]APU21932.1 putative DUF4184 family protein [Actinoalloteichus sp. GBA129-24]